METLLKPALSAILTSEGGGLADLQQLFLLKADDPLFLNRIQNT